MEILDMFSNFKWYILETALNPSRFFQNPPGAIVTFNVTFGFTFSLTLAPSLKSLIEM